MAKFIDQHPTNPNMPPEVLALIRERLLSGERDEFGESGINVFVGLEQTFCYTDAPDKEAVRKAHEMLGVLLGPEDITEVEVLP